MLTNDEILLVMSEEMEIIMNKMWIYIGAIISLLCVIIAEDNKTAVVVCSIAMGMQIMSLVDVILERRQYAKNKHHAEKIITHNSTK